MHVLVVQCLGLKTVNNCKLIFIVLFLLKYFGVSTQGNKNRVAFVYVCIYCTAQLRDASVSLEMTSGTLGKFEQRNRLPLNTVFTSNGDLQAVMLWECRERVVPHRETFSIEAVLLMLCWA